MSLPQAISQAPVPAYGEVHIYGVNGIFEKHRVERTVSDMTGFKTVFETQDAGAVTFVARRINLANLGTEARLIVRGSLDQLDEFIDHLLDIDDESRGDLILDYSGTRRFSLSKRCRAASISPDYPSSNDGALDFCMDMCVNYSHAPEKHPADDDEQDSVDDERERDMEELRKAILTYVAKYHADPTDMLKELIKGKIVLNPQGFSRVVVNGNTQIVLADYDETEVKMGARERTLYIFFLRHLEGMKLVDVPDYRDELLDIYSIVKPGASDKTARRAVDNLCDLVHGSLSETISRIKKAVTHVIRDTQTASQYYINGKRGGVYSIAINPDLVSLPRALTA